MKTFSSYTQMSKEYFQKWTKRYSEVAPQYENPPREDYHLASNVYPIYIVADGVTLKRDVNGNYPVPSGAFELAKKFCHTVMEEAEKRYVSFKESDLKEIFEIGNRVAGEFNDAEGRTKETIDYREFDLFACTTAFVLVKDSKMFWWSLCDSGVSVFGFDGNQKVQSPDAWPDEREKIASMGNAELSDTEFNKLKKKTFRNILDAGGNRFGYGVVTGESSATAYLNTGSLSLSEGDIIFTYTDGYEDYIKLPEFLDYFINWKVESSDKLSEYMISKNIEDVKYGRERSLIAIKS